MLTAVYQKDFSESTLPDAAFRQIESVRLTMGLIVVTSISNLIHGVKYPAHSPALVIVMVKADTDGKTEGSEGTGQRLMAIEVNFAIISAWLSDHLFIRQ